MLLLGNIDRDISSIGISGALLAFIVTFVTCYLTVFCDIYIIKGPGHAAWALYSIGDSAVALP